MVLPVLKSNKSLWDFLNWQVHPWLVMSASQVEHCYQFWMLFQSSCLQKHLLTKWVIAQVLGPLQPCREYTWIPGSCLQLALPQPFLVICGVSQQWLTAPTPSPHVLGPHSTLSKCSVVWFGLIFVFVFMNNSILYLIGIFFITPSPNSNTGRKSCYWISSDSSSQSRE